MTSATKSIVLHVDEVRRLLAGEKVEIRRQMNPQPELWQTNEGPRWAGHKPDGGYHDIENDALGRFAATCPFGAPGERRWAGEAWASWEERCTEDWLDDDHVCGPHCQQTYAAHEATPRIGYRPVPDKARITYLDESTPLDRNPKLRGPWKPAVEMPRWASRLSVSISAVRCERSTDGKAWEWVLTTRRAER